MREWAAYQRLRGRGKSPIERPRAAGLDAIRLEELYLGLRTSDGAARLTGSADDHRGVGARVGRERRDRLQLTSEGWLRLDALVPAIQRLGQRRLSLLTSAAGPRFHLCPFQRADRARCAYSRRSSRRTSRPPSPPAVRRSPGGSGWACRRPRSGTHERAGGQGVPLSSPHLRRPDPTDRAYRVYVERDHAAVAAEPRGAAHAAGRSWWASRSAVEEILRRAAQVLGVLTQELGVAVAPALDEVVLERLELVQVASERLLLVFNLRSGVVRTIFVEVPAGSGPRRRCSRSPDPERAARRTDAAGDPRHARRAAARRRRHPGGRELLNIFIAEGDGLFDLPNEAERGRAGQRPDAGRPAGVRLQRPDARSAPADRGPRPAEAGAGARRQRGSPSPSAPRTPTPG